MARNTTKKSIMCEYEGCNRGYCSLFNLKRHVESSHYGVKKFKCSICGRMLSSKQNLVDHQNIHTGAKPYKCEVLSCNLEFRQLSQYYLHKQLHMEISSRLEGNSSCAVIDLKTLASKLSSELTSNDYFIPKAPYSITDLDLPLISNSILETKTLLPTLNFSI